MDFCTIHKAKCPDALHLQVRAFAEAESSNLLMHDLPEAIIYAVWDRCRWIYLFETSLDVLYMVLLATATGFRLSDEAEAGDRDTVIYVLIACMSTLTGKAILYLSLELIRHYRHFWLGRKGKKEKKRLERLEKGKGKPKDYNTNERHHHRFGWHAMKNTVSAASHWDRYLSWSVAWVRV